MVLQTPHSRKHRYTMKRLLDTHWILDEEKHCYIHEITKEIISQELIEDVPYHPLGWYDLMYKSRLENLVGVK
jgi:hypothetical protein